MSTPPSNFKTILDAALSNYKIKTGKELLDHPLATELQRRDTVDAVLAILQDQAKEFQHLMDGDQRLMVSIGPLTRVLFAFSGTLGVGDVGLAFPPAKGIIAGIGILLAAAKDVRASHDALVELFERIENPFKRLGDYTQVSLTTEMAEVSVKIMAEVLSILSITTKEVKRWRAKIYFRRLLGRTDIEDALKMLDSLIEEQIRMATTQATKATSELKDDVKTVSLAVANIDGIKWDQKGPDVRKWFSPPDPSTNHNSACGVYCNVPSMWFFGDSVFNDWMSSGSLLWVHGQSGSGKTILCSAIIQHITKLRDAGQATLAYYYFDFRDKEKQNVRNFITSVLVQLSESSNACREIIHRLYSAHGNGTRQPSNGALTDCLKEMLTVAAEHRVFIIIDSLDECPDTSEIPTPREAILDVVKDLSHPHHPNLRFCVTSRPEVDVQTKLKPLAISAVSLHGQSGRKRDIANYVNSVVSLDEKLREWRDEDKKLVVEELSEKADGMFQWVHCQLETLRRSVQPDVRGVLEQLPKTLDETYERVLKDIDENNREHARRLLHCLAVSVRPLRVEELVRNPFI
ncbi:hypothetical protein EDB84DRAFT_369073 [Lactarius hengduanensis]|nr:hypothetical protein EDB84DRAFT_369073 [Lactarius hengduanensis]